MKKHYHIEGRQVARRRGGMYCTVRIFHNGGLLVTLPMIYGCGSYIVQRAGEWLAEHGHPALKERYENGFLKHHYFIYLRETLLCSVSIITVARERDL